jgi:hypothetical protein
MFKIRTFLKLPAIVGLVLLLQAGYTAEAKKTPQAILLLEAPRSTARLTQSWPIKLVIQTQQPELATCRPTDWPSRVVWQVSQVGVGSVPLAPLVSTQSVATAGDTPVVLTPLRPLLVTINLRQYLPAQSQAWQPGLYRVSARVALCTPGNLTQPLWINSRYPVYLDITP